jgi:hypothetical protein
MLLVAVVVTLARGAEVSEAELGGLRSTSGDRSEKTTGFDG